MYESFAKVSRNYSLPHNDYTPPVQESMFDFATTVQKNMETLATTTAKATGLGSAESLKRSGSGESEIPKSLSHALCKVANQHANTFGLEEPLGAALSKIATVHNSIGEAKLRMDDEVTVKFYEPCMHTLTEMIALAMVLDLCYSL